MRTWRICVSTIILVFAALGGCSLESGPDPAADLGATSAAVIGGLLQYGGDYIREHATVRVVFWRTSNGVAVSAPTRAVAGPMVSAIVAGSYFDWLKSEYTTPAAMSPVGVSLVPNAGSYAGQLETTSGLTTIISDAAIRAQIAAELAAGNLGPHSGNTSTDHQLVVLVVVPAGVSVRDIGAAASNSDVPYHANTFGVDSIAYVVVRDDADFVANGSAGILSAILNPSADATFRAWSGPFLDVPFREVGCFNAGATVPVFDPTTSMTLPAAPLYSNAQAACIGPPLQISNAAGNPAGAAQTQSVAPGAQPGPFTFFATNRSVATVSLSSAPGCAFAAPTLAPGAVARLDCTASSSIQTVLLSAGFGAITYRTAVTLTVACAPGAVFDGTTCVQPTFDCSECECGCTPSHRACRACPPPHCNPKIGCED